MKFLIIVYITFLCQNVSIADNVIYKNNRADQITKELREKLNNLNCKIHYLHIESDLSLSIWVMMSDLDRDSGKDVSYYKELAFKRGNEIITIAKKNFPDLGRVFDIINPMIVDSYCNSWYIDYVQLNYDSFKKNFYSHDDEKRPSYLRTKTPLFKEPNWEKLTNSVDTLTNNISNHSNTINYIVTERGESKEQVFIVVQEDFSDEDIINFTIKIKNVLKKYTINITIVELFLLDNDGKLFSYSIIDGNVSKVKDNKIKKHVETMRF